MNALFYLLLFCFYILSLYNFLLLYSFYSLFLIFDRSPMYPGNCIFSSLGDHFDSTLKGDISDGNSRDFRFLDTLYLTPSKRFYPFFHIHYNTRPLLQRRSLCRYGFFLIHVTLKWKYIPLLRFSRNKKRKNVSDVIIRIFSQLCFIPQNSRDKCFKNLNYFVNL